MRLRRGTAGVGTGSSVVTLQQAQNLCDSAAQSLCDVRGFANEWSALTKPYDAVKAAWYKIESRRMALVQKEAAL